MNNREPILARIYAILETFKSAPTPLNMRLITTSRNRGKLDNEKLPAGFLLDGDERTTLSASGKSRNRMSPVLVTMTPQIFIVLKLIGAKNSETLGPLLNEYQKMILKGLATDATLLSLIGSNGDLSYDGMITDLKTGMPMEGEAQLNLSIRYFMNPYRL